MGTCDTWLFPLSLFNMESILSVTLNYSHLLTFTVSSYNLGSTIFCLNTIFMYFEHLLLLHLCNCTSPTPPT